MRRLRVVSSLVTLAVLLASCGPPATGTSTTTTTTTTTTSAIAGPPAPWDQMAHADRQRYMATEVMPRMSAMFAEYDGARFADLDCATCHGDDAASRGFAMPSPSLLPLHPTGSEGQRATVRDYPEGVRFMYSEVLPTMQALLGAPEFDAETGRGFSCYSCHPHAEE